MLQSKTLIIFCLLSMVFYMGCGNKPAHENISEKGLKVSMDTVKTTKEAILHEAVGTVKANTASTISSKLMGTVTSISVKEGDRFKKGDLLLVIDPRQVSAQLRQAQAALKEAEQARMAAISARDQARSGAQLAKLTFDRYQKLMNEASASPQEFDEINAGYQQAQAALAQAEAMANAAEFRVKQAQAAVSAVRVNREDASIRAPYDGYVTAKRIDEGDLATPGTVLLDVKGMDGYRIDMEVPEKYINAIQLNQKVTVILSSLDNVSFQGIVQAISPAVDDKSHSFLVKVSLPEHDSIRAGMIARIFLPVETVGKRLMPVSAIIREGQLTGLFLVDENQTARFRLIRIGKILDQHAEVLSGLRDGDRYVKNPPLGLTDGTQLEVTP